MDDRTASSETGYESKNVASHMFSDGSKESALMHNELSSGILSGKITDQYSFLSVLFKFFNS